MAVYRTIITTQDVKNNAYVDSNVDDLSINNAIQLAQDIDLQNIIGTSLFEYIINQGSALQEPYISLVVNKIKPLLIWQAVGNLVNLKTAKIATTAVAKDNNDNSIALEIVDLNRLSGVIKGYKQHYERMLLAYLNSKIQSFPQFYEYQQDGIDASNAVDNETIFDISRIKNK